MPENGWVALAIGHSAGQFIEQCLVDLAATGLKGHGLVAVGVHESNPAPNVSRRVNKRIDKAQADDISVEPFKAPGELERLALLQKNAIRYEPKSMLIVIDAENLGRLKADPMHALGKDVDTLFFMNLKTIANPAIMVAVCITDNTGADFEKAAYDTLERHTRSQANRPPTLDAAFIVRTDSPLSRVIGDETQQNLLLTKSLVGIWTAPLFAQNPDIQKQGAGVRQDDGKNGHDTQTLIGMAVRTDGLSMRKPDGGIGQLLYPILSLSTRRITAKEAADSIAATTYDLLENLPAPMTTVEPYPYLGPIYQQPDIHEAPISVNLILPFRPTDSKFSEVGNRVKATLNSARRVQLPSGAFVQERGFQVNLLSKVNGPGVAHLGSQRGRFYYQVCVLFPINQRQISTSETASSGEG